MTKPMENPFDPAERLEVLKSFALRIRQADAPELDRVIHSLANWVHNRMADVERKEEKRYQAGRRLGFQEGSEAVSQLRDALKELLREDQ